jgi:glutaredoxin
MKNLFVSIAILFSFFSVVNTTFASDNNVNAYLFYGDGCPHCAKENTFLESIKNDYPTLDIYKYEVYFSRENSLLMQKVAETLGTESGGVPFLVIGDKYYVGFSETLTPIEIEAKINECLKDICPDPITIIVGIESTNTDTIIKSNNLVKEKDKEKENLINKDVINNNTEETEKIVKLPFLGESNINKISLPLLAVLMGLWDGFIPCALWTLLFLISLLLGMNNRKRMWTLGMAFIIASASVYFVFMSAWLNLILFLGFVIWVRLLIGGLALLGGGFSLNKFFKSKSDGCSVVGSEKRQRVFEKLKNIAKQDNLWIALGGIILLAFLVNLVELICSAGLPAVFTQVLAMNNLSNLQYYSYILLYILFFMIDDLFVFFMAMITLQMIGITTKYAKYSHLIGGVLMVIIGVLLIFKPEWLMFG